MYKLLLFFYTVCNYRASSGTLETVTTLLGQQTRDELLALRQGAWDFARFVEIELEKRS